MSTLFLDNRPACDEPFRGTRQLRRRKDHAGRNHASCRGKAKSRPDTTRPSTCNHTLPFAHLAGWLA